MIIAMKENREIQEYPFDEINSSVSYYKKSLNNLQ